MPRARRLSVRRWRSPRAFKVLRATPLPCAVWALGACGTLGYMGKIICDALGYIMRKCRKLMPPPTQDQIKSACKDVAWEYVSLLAAAVEMAKLPTRTPTNHLVRDAFLVHVRNLAVFFEEGVQQFKRTPVPPSRHDDNVYAVDFCSTIGWRPRPFGRRLIRAINKTLHHLTYSRNAASPNHAVFEGYLHVHGTVRLMRQAWANFMSSVKPEFRQPLHAEDISYWLAEHTEKWPVQFRNLENEFERLANERKHDCGWKLDQTPDGQV